MKYLKILKQNNLQLLNNNKLIIKIKIQKFKILTKLKIMTLIRPNSLTILQKPENITKDKISQAFKLMMKIYKNNNNKLNHLTP